MALQEWASAGAAALSTTATVVASNIIFLNTLSPDLKGGQVAVLRLHVASASRATKAAYSCVSVCAKEHEILPITKVAPNSVKKPSELSFEQHLNPKFAGYTEDKMGRFSAAHKIPRG